MNSLVVGAIALAASAASARPEWAVRNEARQPAAPARVQATCAVMEVDTRALTDEHIVVTGIVTPLGRSLVRSPEMVIDGGEWRPKQARPRAAPALSDLNMATTPRWAEGGVREAAVLFRRGFSELEPGPDLFIFDERGDAIDLRLSPIYRMTDESFAEGEAVSVSLTTAAARIEVAGRTLWGMGVDLDSWTKNGLMPEGAVITGVVVRHATGEGTFVPVKMLLADASVEGLVGSDEASAFVSEASIARPVGGGGGFSGGAGGGGGAPPEVPSQGAMTLFGVAALVFAGRGRSRA